MSADTGPLPRLPPVCEALAALAERDAVRRLYDRDPSLWSDDPGVQDSISNRLGWLDAASPAPGWQAQLDDLVDHARGAGLHRVVLAGMGGSSLAPEVFASVFEGSVTGARLAVLDSTHPGTVRALLDDAELTSTLVVVSSKSGTTEETRSFAAHAQQRVEASQLVAITDPGSALEEEARAAGWAQVLTNPADIGGRYSALSLFGMAPAALVGVDTDALWERAGRMLDRCRRTALEDNPAALLGAFMAGLARHGRDKLTLLAPAALTSLGDWIEQLVAESTGKAGTGVVPVVREQPGPVEAYGSDRAFVSLRLAGHEDPAVPALTDAGHPVLSLDLDDPLDVGGELLRWELATAFAGVVLGVNPFDEPNVTESKANTVAVLEDVAAGHPLPSPADDDLVGLLAGLRPGDYVAVQAYLDPLAGYAEPLQRLCRVLRDATGAPATLGWGPRFLHSTGQLHKGGPDTVVSLQLVDATLWTAPAADRPIPGRDYDFATLIRAQAVGDLRSLAAHGRRVAQVGVTAPAGVERIADAVERALR